MVINIRICSSFTKYLHLYSYSISVSTIVLKLPALGNPCVTINMNKKTKLNKNSKFKPLKCPMAYSYP